MIVTKIEPVTKTKYRIELDGEFAFVLYKGELSRFGICQDAFLGEEQIERIKTEVLLKRAKLRAMHLLNDMGRTRAQLREKLLQNQYPEDVTEQALEYVSSFGYLDDFKYAVNFIESRRHSKSRKELGFLLLQKGVSQDVVDAAFEEADGGGGDREAIRELLRKKRFQKMPEEPKELQKIYAYLARKGFRYEDIRQVVQNYNDNA